MAQLVAPNLQRLLALTQPTWRSPGDSESLSPPHERALAHFTGLPEAPDGCIAWAASAAQAKGLRPYDGTKSSGDWAFVHLAHWAVGNHHISMADPFELAIDPLHDQALFNAMQPYFEEDGVQLHPDSAGRWLAQGTMFSGLASASLDRAIGTDLHQWMPQSAVAGSAESNASAAKLRRLQNEMQMLLYTHPVNDARAALGKLPVNSFWVSGTGRLEPRLGHADGGELGDRPDPSLLVGAPPEVNAALRGAALCADWPAWCKAWAMLDASLCANLLAAANRHEFVRITLCGQSHAQTYETVRVNWLQRLKRRLRPPQLNTLLGAL